MEGKIKRHDRVVGVDMLHGPMLKKILMFAIPVGLSSLLQQLFNAADVAVVGRFAGSTAQAAVGSNASVINLIITLFVGLTVGANAVIGNYIGRGERGLIEGAVHTSMALAFSSGIFLIAAGQLLAAPILRFIGTPEDVFSQAVLYLKLYFVGMPFNMTYNFGSAILRSKGDTKRPLISLAASGIINIVLNVILVAGFGLGVVGVAIATDVSYVFNAGLILYFLLNEEEPFRLIFRRLRFEAKALMRIIAIGLPAGLQGMVFALSNVCIQSAINSFGSDAMAGCTIGQNFEFMGYFFVNAFTQAAVTFTSQNYGAGEEKRCRRVFALCMSAAVISNLAFCLTVRLFRYPIVGIFTHEAGATEYAIARISMLMLCHFLISGYEVTAGVMRGRGSSMMPAVITIVGTCVFRLFWVYVIFPPRRSFLFLMWVYPTSWIITTTAMITAYLIFISKSKERQMRKISN